MNRFLLLCIALLPIHLWATTTIRISTAETDLIYRVGDNQRLYQCYFGAKLLHEEDIPSLPQGTEAYLTHGMEDYFEPALDVRHADHNASTLLHYVSHSVTGNRTDITLRDPVYQTTVILHYIVFPEENVIQSWTTITNGEKKPIHLAKYASSMLHFPTGDYYLTSFSGNWAREVEPATEHLTFGKKQLDSKLGARVNLMMPPMFQLSINAPATETEGTVLLGQLGWTGNYRFTFEVIDDKSLRVISGINPYFSEYELAKGASFTTPEFYFTLSTQGLGHASRSLHDWARRYQLRDGQGERLTLLNNWEATYFDFNEDKLCSIIEDAAKLGVDMFLLDDGWFANKYPRNSDTQGLGDWQENTAKLPHKVSHLIDVAKANHVRFGIWIEPEMVSPKSELYERHKDWVITLPNREEYYFRNQLVLDLSNPQVQDFVFGVVDNLMTAYPEIAFFKWDCNSPITNIYSPYLKDKQQHLYVDYVQGLYNVLDRVQAKYPNLPMMLCAGGSGRIDYKALRYFTEFWASDNTDPIQRLNIQHSFSIFYPAKATCCHVTSWNGDTSVKFRTDVAMQGKLGFDIRVNELTADELAYCQKAVDTYRMLQPSIGDGDLYRLVDPHKTQHAANLYVSKNKQQAALFSFDIHPLYDEPNAFVCIDGLDPDKQYTVTEINLMPGKQSPFAFQGQTYSGDYLMKVGLPVLQAQRLQSHVFLLQAR